MSALLGPSHSFPSADLVSASAALLTPRRKWDGAEGPRRRLVVGPGVLTVASHDPARAERAAERAVQRRRTETNLAAVEINLPDLLDDAEAVALAFGDLVNAGLVEWTDVHLERVRVLEEWAGHVAAREGQVRGKIGAWSGKSRARMIRRLAELDYTPMLAGPEVAGMVTVTYPGCDPVAVAEDRAAGRWHVCDARCPWVAVAASPKVCTGHLKALRKRFERAWGRPLVGTWKREFQRRGAPHYHLFMVPPHGEVNGENFRAWLARNWSEVVGHPDPAAREAHRLAGTGIDYREGARASDPRRLAIYFSKHGNFSAKDYQNDAPALWVESGEGVGRFWGYWGLDVATKTVEVSDVEALAAARTLRRWSRANGYVAKREVWRTDTATGVQRKRRVNRRGGGRMRGQLGFVTLCDAPAYLSRLAGHLDAVREDAQRRELIDLGYEPWFAEA